MTDPLGENSRNPAKKQEKHIKYNNNKHNMLVLYKRWEEYNEFELTKKNGLEYRK